MALATVDSLEFGLGLVVLVFGWLVGGALCFRLCLAQVAQRLVGGCVSSYLPTQPPKRHLVQLFECGYGPKFPWPYPKTPAGFFGSPFGLTQGRTYS